MTRTACFAALVAISACGSTSAEPQSPAAAPVSIPADVEQRLAWFPSTDRIVFCLHKDGATLPMLDACAQHFQAANYCTATSAVNAAPDAIVIFGRVDAEALRQCLVGMSNESVSVTANGELVTVTPSAETEVVPFVFLIPSSGTGVALVGEGVQASTVGPGRASSVLDNASVRALLGKVDLAGSWLVAATDITTPLLELESQSTVARLSLTPTGAFTVNAEVVFESAARAEAARHVLDERGMPSALQPMMGSVQLTTQQRENTLLVNAQ